MVERVKQFGKDKEAFYGSLQQTIDACDRQNARLDHFEKQRAISEKRAHAEQQRRDRQRVAAYLDGLPDPDKPDDGELTIHHKPDPAEHGYTFDPDDPDTWGDDEGPAAGPGALVETRPVPDPLDLAHPPSRATQQVPQPIAISLNEE
jgi:hypothetical protein